MRLLANKHPLESYAHGAQSARKSVDVGFCQIGRLSYGVKKASLWARLWSEVRGHGDVGTFPCGSS